MAAELHKCQHFSRGFRPAGENRYILQKVSRSDQTPTKIHLHGSKFVRLNYGRTHTYHLCDCVGKEKNQKVKMTCTQNVMQEAMHRVQPRLGSSLDSLTSGRDKETDGFHWDHQQLHTTRSY